MLKRVLVANRGEIAVRIIRTLREMDITPIAVYSDADGDAPHVRLAAEAYRIGPPPARDSYLDIERILDAAAESKADAVAPGYGFLSENPEFARSCAARGLCFIGPSAESIHDMGSKTEARKRMEAAGVPVVPGGSADDLDDAKHSANAVGYPVLIKASAGGGGKGMRLVDTEAELGAALERAKSEALRAFGDDHVYIEKALVRPRHVEIQVLADQHGNAVHLFERDCSIQRRHQKVIEETPCPVLSAAVLRQMGEISVRAAQAIGYYSAGTFEFLLTESDATNPGAQQFYFLEMNTRLQVEHAITELVTGLDLVREMIRIAQGERLDFDQSQVTRRGAAIECRIYAEDPSRGFLPSPGRIDRLELPGGPGVRDDSGIVSGSNVTPHYDPLLSKLCVWASCREHAILRMRRALNEYRLSGIRTNLEFHRRVMEHPDFVAGNYTTGFIAEHQAALTEPARLDTVEARELALAAASVHEQEAVEAGQRAISRADSTRSAWSERERIRLK